MPKRKKLGEQRHIKGRKLSAIQNFLLKIKIWGLFITLVIIGGASSIKPKCGMCPTITPKDVDVTRLVGDWEEWERSTNAKDETESCGKLSFSAPDANGDVKLIFSAASSIIPTVYVKVRSLDSVNGLEAIVKNALKKRGLPMVQLTKEKRAGCADCFSDD
ncbi:hypothetical protein KQX54_008682 [Cotesia glomerata]|uniref:Uncharacterized protein n=1 Tax=Cotesia glomerata TaxID=32391 RepID=A0AAV7J8H5_COTGL|nr:hypothetical protein KQX54_008682 [Cotesia glomerata]